MFRQDIKDKVR